MAEFGGGVAQSAASYLPSTGTGGPVGQSAATYRPSFYGGPIAQSGATYRPSFYGGPIASGSPYYKASRFGGQTIEGPLEQRSAIYAGPSVEQPMALPAIAPVINAMSAAQRDAGPTWLVDVHFAVHDPSGEPLQRVLEYSLTGDAGPWLPAQAQPYDRRHTAISPLPTEDATAAPGAQFTYVWSAYQALPAGLFQVHFRLTVTDANDTSDSEIVGPIAITTVDPPAEATPLERALAKRELVLGDLDFLGNGLLVPFTRGSRDFLSVSGPQLVRACVREILRTRAAVGDFPGDLPWRPDFGSKLWALRHRNNDGLLRAQAMTYVLEALQWEPRVEVIDVLVEREDTILSVRVTYRLIEENVEENQVILPEFEELVPIG